MKTKLKEARTKLKMKQGEVAKFSGISLKSYQRIEQGKQEPRVSSAKLIAKALKSTVEELF